MTGISRQSSARLQSSPHAKVVLDDTENIRFYPFPNFTGNSSASHMNTNYKEQHAIPHRRRRRQHSSTISEDLGPLYARESPSQTGTLSYQPIDYAASARAASHQASRPTPRRMPHAEVRFAPTTEFSRQPTSDELALFNAFADHQYVCSDCDLKHRGMCDRGIELAGYIAERIYYDGGKTFSSKDRENHVPVQIEIPIGCESVRTLLKALEKRNRKAQQQSSRPAQSYDRTYSIPARPAQYASVPPQSSRPSAAAAAAYYPAATPGYASQPKASYYMPFQYPAPLPLPPRTRKRYSVSQPAPAPAPAQAFTVYEAPDPVYSYYR